MSILVEACVDAIDAALEAERGGAGRVELCGELLQGGVTPSAGLIAAVWERVDIPVFVLIRPRAGDFLYDANELDVMLRDVEMARSLDADGVVIGALTPQGDIDVDTVRKLVDAAGDMPVTFHRAFDFARDQQAALDALIALGVTRVLTSGGAATALEGAPVLARLVEQAGKKIIILAGGSISAENVEEVVRVSGVREVHVRASARIASAMVHRREEVTLARSGMIGDYERIMTRSEEMFRVVEAVATSAE
ncbi:MAG: copper homeostasis protein CutC [bacterium]